MITKLLPYIGWILAIGLGIIEFKQCSGSKFADTTKGDTIFIHSKDEHLKDSAEIVRLGSLYATWRNKYDSLYSSFVLVRGKIVKSGSKIQELIDSNNLYRSKLDTLSQITNCEELASQDSVLLELLSQASIELDSLSSSHKKEREASDSALLACKSDNTQLSFAISDLRHEYEQAVANENKAVKKAKLNNVFAKIGNFAAIILAGALILKK